MAVPRNRHSNARKNKRRSHLAKKKKNILSCTNCQKPTLPHNICNFCGFYSNRQILNIDAKKNDSEKSSDNKTSE
jgi:large subunit ribosomal protein L32